MKSSTRAIKFLESLRIPEGPNAGNPVKLAPFQKKFVKGALADGISTAVLSIGRGNGKSALSAGIALAALMGDIDPQPRREIVIAARTRDQGRIAFEFAAGFLRSLHPEVQTRFKLRRSPRLEIELDEEHVLKVIAADGRSALGGAPTLCLLDERGHWEKDKGDDLEHALLSGLGKRGGRALIISTSAATDSHPFSKWIDEPPPGTYVQEHRPSPGMPADDVASLMEANPGAKHGIGSSVEWLKAEAARALSRGGAALNSFRLYNRNERVSGETRDQLLTVDEWLACETAEPPARDGECIIGIDLGGSASMSAAAYYWPKTGRLECYGTFPGNPNLSNRGQGDTVGNRYVEMQDRGELVTIGDRTVPVAPWLHFVLERVEGCTIGALCADRYKQAEISEALDKVGFNAPVIWRGMGFKDGGEDCERFRRAAYDGKVLGLPSLLMRSAFADAVCLRDPANNLKLAKARSLGRIDPVAASVLAVAEGARRTGRQRSSMVVGWV